VSSSSSSSSSTTTTTTQQRYHRLLVLILYWSTPSENGDFALVHLREAVILFWWRLISWLLIYNILLNSVLCQQTTQKHHSKTHLTD
jgi:hypothetical protein